MYATHYLESIILNVFRGTTATGFTSLTAGLFTTSPTNTGTAGTEISYTGYARQPITFVDFMTSTYNPGTQNSAQIKWPMSSIAAGTVRFIGVYSGANMILYGELTTPLSVLAGQAPTAAAYDIRYYITGTFGHVFKQSIMSLFRGVSISGFTPYFALFNGNPESGGVELSGGGYARRAVTFGAPAVLVTGGKTTIKNTSSITMPTPTASWGYWSYDALMESSTSTNIKAFAQNPVPENIGVNYALMLNVGDYTISVD